MKRINSILLIFIITLSLILPTTTVVYADSEKEEVTNVEGVSDNIDTIPVWGGEYTNPTITIEDEECRAYFDTENGTWQRKEGESWSDEHVSNKFRAGTWRYKCNVYIDNSGMTFPDAGDTHKLAEKINVKINGKVWTADNSVIKEDNSRAMVYSNEYIIDEPEDLVAYDSNKLDIGTNTVDIPITQYSIASYVEGGTKPYTFSKKSGPDWVKVSNDGTISGTPTPTEDGTNKNLIILIKDSSNREQELKISVANTEINLNNRKTISEVTATSNIDSIAVFEKDLSNKPTFTVLDESPAYFKSSKGIWQKKNENTGSWENTNGLGQFDKGIWRFTCNVYIDNEGDMPNAGDTYKLANNIKVKVDGKEWKVDKTEYVDELHSSIAKVYSPEYFLTEPNYYIVSFDSNGGSFVKNDIVFKGHNVEKPEEPKKEGYAFAGWFKDKELKNEFNFEEDTISEHTTLYAKWLKYYMISAKTSLYGVERGRVEGTGKYKEGDKVTLKAIVDDGYYLEVWKEGDKELSKDTSYSFIVSRDRDIRAIVQTLEKYEVKFETNGGTAIQKQTVWTNKPYATKPDDPKKEGCVFEGWYADKEFKRIFDFKNTKIEKHTTIYAKWHKHTVTNVAAKSATCKATGNISYYKCKDCNKIFKDSNGTQEIILASTITPRVAHVLKEEVISKQKTKATLSKNGKIVRTIQEKCSVCGDLLTIKTTTEKIYYPKTIKLSKKTFKYNKNVQKPEVIVKDSNGKIIDTKYYDIEFSNKKSKKVGEYKVTIKFKGNYKGTKELKYTIKPQGTTIKKLKAGSKQFKAIWNKNTNQTSGYQIQFATNSKFTKNSNKELIEDNKKTSNKFKNLKAKKKYFVRIRTYKTVKGKKFYSSWSEALKVKTKK